MGRLNGRVALVTGGGSGVGLATAKLLLAERAKVAICGRTVSKIQAAAAALDAGANLFATACDVTMPDKVESMVRAVTAKFGRIDILVNNAGTNIKNRTMKEMTPEAWRAMLAANLDGAFYCTAAVLPQMRDRKDGVIININSIAGKRSGPLGGVAYNAAKFGMSALGICVGAEEKDNGIRVCNIYPGEIDTPILEHRPTPVPEAQRKLILKPEDVADAVLFVAALPARASVPELVIKPTTQIYV